MIFGVNIHLKQFSISANCAVGEIRLVGGSTDKEGRVEVCVAAGNGGQFALAVKNWQELFVHKWDTSLKLTQWIDKIMCCEL